MCVHKSAHILVFSSEYFFIRDLVNLLTFFIRVLLVIKYKLTTTSHLHNVKVKILHEVSTYYLSWFVWIGLILLKLKTYY